MRKRGWWKKGDGRVWIGGLVNEAGKRRVDRGGKGKEEHVEK